jgi:hypothetical protein
MFCHHANTASFFSALIGSLLLSLAGVASAQTENTSLGTGALQNKATGTFNTAIGITMSLQF